MSDAASSACAWALPSDNNKHPSQAAWSKLQENFILAVDKFGGPGQFLRNKLDTEGARKAFADYLVEKFPEDAHQQYETTDPLTAVIPEEISSTPPLCVHVSALGYDEDCSLKPFPPMDVFREHIEQFIQDGFLSAGDPLIASEVKGDLNTCGVVFGRPALNTIRPFTIAWVKGMARSCSLLSLLFLLQSYQNGDWEKEFPKLHQTAGRIFIHCNPFQNKMDEAIENMKISLRGAIRRAVNVIQLAFMIDNLVKKHGVPDFGTFVRRWNSGSLGAHRIIGKQACALKLLFEVASRDLARDHKPAKT